MSEVKIIPATEAQNPDLHRTLSVSLARICGRWSAKEAAEKQKKIATMYKLAEARIEAGIPVTETYTVGWHGEVLPLESPAGNERMPIYILRDTVVAGLRVDKENKAAMLFAEEFRAKWNSSCLHEEETAHGSIRRHIATCLAYLRHVPRKNLHNRTDYLLLCLAEGPTWPSYVDDLYAATKRL